MKKRLASILIAFCIVGALLPTNASAYSIAGGKHGSDFTDGVLAERLETIFYNGISGCVSPNIPAVGGAMNNSQAYTTTYANHSGSSTDWQCVAYARAAYSYLFGYNVGIATYQNSFNSVTSGKNSVSYDLFQRLGVRCGAYMRTTGSSSGAWDPVNGHSILILGYNSATITTLEGNYTGTGGVGILNYTWNDFNRQQLSGRGRYICGFAQPTEAIYASVTSGGTSTQPAPNPPQYFACDVRIDCVYGQIVNLYNNLGDRSSADYFSKGQSTRSVYGAKLNDGSTWYQISATSLGITRDFWLKYESDKMTVTDIHPESSAPCTHDWGSGVVTKEATFTSTGERTYTCSVCGEIKTETLPMKTTVSGRCWNEGDGEVRWTLTNSGTVTISGSGTLNQLSSDLGEEIDQVKHVVVEEGITKTKLSFMECKSIQTIQLPASVSDLRISAFLGCPSLKEVTVNEQNPWFKSVDGVLFTKSVDTLILCPAARSGNYRIPDGVKTIANASFGGTKLSTVEIPASVTDIAEYCFEDGPIMLVHSGSYAEQYAKTKGCSYKLLDAPSISEPDRIQVIIPLGTLDGLKRFKQTKTYSDGIFHDVAADAWYRENVAAAYELGLMNGTGEKAFQPEKNVTIAEAVTLAARIHSIYYAKTTPFETYDGGNWYDPYVNYAKNNGLLSENHNYNQPATREEFVHILAQGLPGEALKPITEAPVFADAGYIIYSAEVDLFSRAGVITGSEDDGALRFRPESLISRAEVAAVVTRMAKAELRKN